MIAFILAVGLVSAVGTASAADSAADASNACEVAWQRLFDKFRSPKTGLLYEHLPDEAPGAVERFLPTPDEIARNEPIATGWNTGMEDGVLNGCPLILAALLRQDGEALEKLVPGVLRCATVSKVPGFLARSLSPVDGTSHYANSSRDQYTLFVYTMWRYARSPFCPPARRAEIAKAVADIARYVQAGLCARNGYSILREDGRVGVVCKMWMADPAGKIEVSPSSGRVKCGGLGAHEAGRLPMIYAAAGSLTGDRQWRERELEVADAALRVAEADPYTNYVGFTLLQLQVSQRLLWECETDAVRRGRYLKLMHRVAEASLRGMRRAEDLFAGLKGDLTAPAGDWRTWPREDLSAAIGGADGRFNGLPYGNPVRPKAFLDAYTCVREMGQAIVTPLLCPGFRLDEAYVRRFRALAVKAGFGRHMSDGLVYPVLAGAMLGAGIGYN